MPLDRFSPEQIIELERRIEESPEMARLREQLLREEQKETERLGKIRERQEVVWAECRELRAKIAEMRRFLDRRAGYANYLMTLTRKKRQPFKNLELREKKIREHLTRQFGTEVGLAASQRYIKEQNPSNVGKYHGRVGRPRKVQEEPPAEPSQVPAPAVEGNEVASPHI